MICSCAAVQGEEVLERTMEQKEIKYAAFTRIQKRVLIVDRFKFEEKGIYRFASLRDFDLVATDCPPPKVLLNKEINFIYNEE